MQEGGEIAHVTFSKRVDPKRSHGKNEKKRKERKESTQMGAGGCVACCACGLRVTTDTHTTHQACTSFYAL